MLLSDITDVTVQNGSPGKIVLGSVTLQWGYGESSDAGTENSFGTAFSGTAYCVIPNQNAAASSPDAEAVEVVSVSSTEFVAKSASNISICWMAIGPT